MIKRLFLLIFIIFTQLSYSVNMDDIVDGFIDMKINRIDEKFYPLYIDELRQIGYLPMKNFLALIELENNKVDLENMSVTVKLPDGKERSYTFSDEYAFVDGEELYVNIYEIGKLLPAKKVEFNLATLISKIDFDFSLPSVTLGAFGGETTNGKSITMLLTLSSSNGKLPNGSIFTISSACGETSNLYLG